MTEIYTPPEPLSLARMRPRAGALLNVAVLLSFAASSTLFFGFTAEDAYILFRYVENFHALGTWAYNPGERINALTSPLHALLLGALFTATRETVLTAKLAGLLMALVPATLAWRRYASEPGLAAFALTLMLLPTSTVLWIYGGLETPLLACLTGLAALAVTRAAGVHVVCVLAGLGFLVRYDSALFFAPLALHALIREPAWRSRIGATLLGAAAPIAWLAIAFGYFGDIFPTSFYVKGPRPSLTDIARNGVYVGAWLVLTGMLPALLLFMLAESRPCRERLRRIPAAIWMLVAGLAAELVYATTIATTHMMFSFRSFAPYAPAAAIVLAELWRREPASPRSAPWLAAFVLVASVCHPAHAWFTYERSANGLSPVGEYRHTSVRAFGEFMQTLSDQARAIEADWRTRPASRERPLRLATYAGGLVPYELPSAYVYELLASYRHDSFRYWNWSQYADYTMVLTPFFGDVEEQLTGGRGRYERVFAREQAFAGRPQRFEVYFNPAPEPHPPLGSRLDGCCGRE